jgi:hypothetical protein
VEIIPEKCLEFVPFIPEGISSWSNDTNLLRYLRCLFDAELTMTAITGEQHVANTIDYGNSFFDEGKHQFRALATQFLRNGRKAKPTPAAKERANLISDLRNDKCFGLMAKNYIAWDGVVSAILSESAFFSIAHVLESIEELDCSMLLACHLHYKQALQVLRNFVEGVVLQLYFCENEIAFVAWKNNQFRVPSFRGRNGVLENLLSRRIISEELTDTASTIYGQLNSTVHGAEIRFTNRGTFTGDWSGRVFSRAQFEEWCRYFAQCVGLAIPVMRVHINIWRDICSADPATIRCDICHSTNDLEIEKSDLSANVFSPVHCRKCGNSMILSSEMLQDRRPR